MLTEFIGNLYIGDLGCLSANSAAYIFEAGILIFKIGRNEILSKC